jgi:hypothetical protein
MSNQEQLDILKQGVEVWNMWRVEHPDIRPDLREADLPGTHRHCSQKHTTREILG